MQADKADVDENVVPQVPCKGVARDHDTQLRPDGFRCNKEHYIYSIQTKYISLNLQIGVMGMKYGYRIQSRTKLN